MKAMDDDVFDYQAFRSHFPPLEQLAHFASCSQGALSREVHYALADLTRSMHLHGAPWDEWMARTEELRTQFASFINTTPDHVALLPSASAGAYQVASAFDWSGSRILTSDLEFPSVGQVLCAQERNGATIDFITDRDAALEADTWSARIRDDTKLVSVPLVSYHNGAMPDVRTIIAAAHHRGAVALVDAYQGAGVVPVDVQELDCDYLVTGSLKYMLGLAGVAFLYVKDVDRAERLPDATGWFGRENPFGFDPRDTSYPHAARRFEGGTPSVPAVYASLAGLRLLSTVDPARGFAHVKAVRAQLVEELTKQGIPVSEPADALRQGPQVAPRFADPARVAARLADRGIIAAPRNDVLRMSLHYYTSPDDVDRAVAAMRDAA
jgi:selenocysteine lyase/cysteine desulfurase